MASLHLLFAKQTLTSHTCVGAYSPHYKYLYRLPKDYLSISASNAPRLYGMPRTLCRYKLGHIIRFQNTGQHFLLSYTLEGLAEGVNTLAISPDGVNLLSGCE